MTGSAKASILAIHNAYRQRGGEESVLRAEIDLLERNGHRVDTLIVDNRDLDEHQGPAQTLRLAARTVWSEPARRLVRRAIDRFRPDLVHVHNTFPRLSPSIYSACQAAGVPVVQSIHNYRLICPAATLFRDGRECNDCVGRIPFPAVIHACYRDSRPASAVLATMLTVHRARKTWSREVDAFLVYSEPAADILVLGGLPRDRIHVRAHFVPDRGVRTGPGGYVLFVGRLTNEKGVDLLLEAVERLPPEIELRIAGEGPLSEAVHAARARGRPVTPLGFVSAERVQEEMVGARALVFTSRTHEMGPLTVIEAFAAGIPVIAPAFGVLPLIVEHGHNGLLYAAGDPGSLAGAMIRAMARPDEMEAFGRHARERFLERHTADRSYASLTTLYDRVLQERAA